MSNPVCTPTGPSSWMTPSRRARAAPSGPEPSLALVRRPSGSVMSVQVSDPPTGERLAGLPPATRGADRRGHGSSAWSRSLSPSR